MHNSLVNKSFDDWEGDMAAGMDFSPPFTILEGSYNKDNVSVAMESHNSDNLDNLKQTTNGKPPRHLSVMGQSVGSMRLLAAADLVTSSCLMSFFGLHKDADLGLCPRISLNCWIL